MGDKVACWPPKAKRKFILRRIGRQELVFRAKTQPRVGAFYRLKSPRAMGRVASIRT